MMLISMSWRQGKYRHIGASKLLEETLILQGLQKEDLELGVGEKVAGLALQKKKVNRSARCLSIDGID